MLSLFFNICMLFIQLLLKIIKFLAKIVLLCFGFIITAFTDLGKLSWKNENDRASIVKNIAIIVVSAGVAIFIIWFVYAFFFVVSSSKPQNTVIETRKSTTIAQTTQSKINETTKAPIIKEETTKAPETTILETTIPITAETTIIIPETTIVETTLPQTTIVETTQIIETIPPETSINNEHINDNFYIDGRIDTYSETFDIEEDYSSKANIVIPKICGKDAEKVARANEFMESAKEDLIGEAESILSEESPAYKSLSIIQNEVSSQSSNKLRITMSGTLKTNSGTSKNIKYVFTYDVENDDYDLERKQ